MPQRIVIGRFVLGNEGVLWLREHGYALALSEALKPMDDDGIDRRAYYALSHDIERTDTLLIACIEALGNSACAAFHTARIVEVPDGVEWHISSDDELGDEWVAENHRTWS